MIDHEQLQILAQRLAVPAAVRSFPDGGDAAIRAVYQICQRVFRTIDPSQLEGPVIIFSQAHQDAAAQLTSGTTVVDLAGLKQFVEAGFTIEVNSLTNAMQLWVGGPPIDVEQLSKVGVVFLHEHGSEKFLISDEEVCIPRIFAGEQSIFSVPHYADLAEALAHYNYPIVRHSECPILETVWHDKNRLFLIEKPENTIQRSLQKFLHFTLRGDAEVMREQNVDDTHPVDIRITFHFTNRVALIEVKWLGRSKHSDGSQATPYTAQRAVDGAHQLAGYLNSFANSSPSSVVKGYLVVLDARRRGLTGDATTINCQNGMYYAHREIEFNPKYEVERNDFNQPIRMFAEPICS